METKATQTHTHRKRKLKKRKYCENKTEKGKKEDNL